MDQKVAIFQFVVDNLRWKLRDWGGHSCIPPLFVDNEAPVVGKSFRSRLFRIG